MWGCIWKQLYQMAAYYGRFSATKKFRMITIIIKEGLHSFTHGKTMVFLKVMTKYYSDFRSHFGCLFKVRLQQHIATSNTLLSVCKAAGNLRSEWEGGKTRQWFTRSEIFALSYTILLLSVHISSYWVTAEGWNKKLFQMTFKLKCCFSSMCTCTHTKKI